MQSRSTLHLLLTLNVTTSHGGLGRLAGILLVRISIPVRSSRVTGVGTLAGPFRCRRCVGGGGGGGFLGFAGSRARGVLGGFFAGSVAR